MNTPATPKDSSQEQETLRKVALWAAEYASLALPVFERHHPNDTRPRDAIEAAKAFGHGKKRDKNLRVIAMDALRAGSGADDAVKYAARAAMLAAAVAYTHTDLQTGLQGIRQAQHILGPAVYTALALETVSNRDTSIDDAIIQKAANDAPDEVKRLLHHMPAQPTGKSGRLPILFANLDTALRNGSPTE